MGFLREMGWRRPRAAIKLWHAAIGHAVGSAAVAAWARLSNARGQCLIACRRLQRRPGSAR